MILEVLLVLLISGTLIVGAIRLMIYLFPNGANSSARAVRAANRARVVGRSRKRRRY